MLTIGFLSITLLVHVKHNCHGANRHPPSVIRLSLYNYFIITELFLNYYLESLACEPFRYFLIVILRIKTKQIKETMTLVDFINWKSYVFVQNFVFKFT